MTTIGPIALEWVPVRFQIMGPLADLEIGYEVGQRHSERSTAVAEGRRLTGGSDDFVIARLRGDLLLEVAGSNGAPVERWSDEDDYRPMVAALGAVWLPKRGAAG